MYSLKIKMNHLLKRNGMDYYKVNKIDHKPLKFDKIYALESITHIFMGTYSGIMRDEYGYILCILRDVTKKDKQGQLSKIEGASYFSREYTFYDVEEIREKSLKAKLSMEERALN
jgi:hypothetical protein